MRKFIATLGATALIVGGTVTLIPSANAAAPVVETTAGKLTNGAAYTMKVPARFNGTFFIWNHGFRPSYDYPSYKAPTGVEELTPFSVNRNADITAEMLKAGYGIASYDRASTGGLHGWNTTDGVAMLNDMVDTARAKYTNIKKVVVYGSSGATPVINQFIEKYPDKADAVGLLGGLTATSASIQSACDYFYLLSVFADPTIKGCAAFGVAKGPAGHMASLGELQKVGALLTAWSKDLGAKPIAYPAPLAAAGIPQRSALLLAGLMVGIPTKSAHMDGISTSAVIAEHSINATVAILENSQEALGTGTFAGQAIGELIGPGFYDNTKTDWSALLSAADSGRFNLGLSGDDAIAGMLGVLRLVPRVKGDPAVVAKFKALDTINYTSDKPTILLSNEADRLVFAGNSALYVDNARASYKARLAKYKAGTGTKPVWNTFAMYSLTPEIYTKFSDAGLPDLSGPVAESGVGHQSFTTAQMMGWVKLLAQSAKTGKAPSQKFVGSSIFAKIDPNLNTDPDFLPNLLKYKS